MTTPAECAEKFPDEPGIDAQAQLLRRVPPWHFVSEPSRVRPSSAAFEDDEDGEPMSVYRLEIILAEGGAPDRVMAGHEGYAPASVAAGLARSRQQTVHPDPLPEESSHTVVCGRKTGGVRREFARSAIWVIPPPA